MNKVLEVGLLILSVTNLLLYVFGGHDTHNMLWAILSMVTVNYLSHGEGTEK